MKKITDLLETRWRTVHSKDEYGNRHRETQEYLAKRLVKSVSEGPRIGHFIIDLIAFQICISIADYFFQLIAHITNFNFILNLTAALVAGLSSLLMYPILYIICEYKWQKTPGKFITKTVVIDEYGNKPDIGTLILRNILRYVPFEPLTCFGKHSHGWHDKWSKTWVVTKEELATIKQLQAEQVSDLHE